MNFRAAARSSMPTSPADQVAAGPGRGLEVSSLVAGYGSTTIVHGMSLTAAPAQVVGVVGPNGAGKSTLLKAVAGAIRATAGMLRISGVTAWLGSASATCPR